LLDLRIGLHASSGRSIEVLGSKEVAGLATMMQRLVDNVLGVAKE